MDPIFEILPDKLEPEFTNLYCEVSEDSLLYFFQNDSDKVISGLSYFKLTVENVNSNFAVKNILDTNQVLRKQFNKVFIAYSFSEMVLVPENMYQEMDEASLIDTLYGEDIERKILMDNVPELEVNNYYSVPLNLHTYIQTHCPEADFKHSVSYLLKQPFSAGTTINVLFYQCKFLCTVWKDGKLLLSNNFRFLSAEDVVYHLLNICKQLNIPELPSLLIGGMIEKDSALAVEIKKYFNKVEFDNHNAKLSENLLYFPSHYFSHMFSIA